LPGSSAAEVEEQVKAWSMTSFFNLTRKERWDVIKDVMRNYEDLCVIAAKAKRTEHAKAKVERLKEARAKEIARCQDRAANYAKFAAIPLCTKASELESLRADHADDDKKFISALRDQIRVRKHVYGIGDLPNIGSGNGVDELARLEGSLLEQLDKPLPKKPHAPTPYPVRAPHHAPSLLATRLDQQYALKISEAWLELVAMTSQLIFRVPRATANRTARAPAQQARRDVPSRDAALRGTTFTEDDVD